jgi:hypothetical protein
MSDFQNTLVYREDWVDKVQERLNEPNKFKDICNVEYTNTKVLHNPYLTDPSVSTGVRGCSYTMAAVTETDDNVSITTFKIVAQFIDRADAAQSTFLAQMNMADRQATLLNEAIETAVYADFASLTTFDASTTMGGSGSITVSASNIDDIIRGVYQKILAAGGAQLLERNGAFFVWRPADFNILQGFAQANGFSTADAALRGTSNPSIGGFEYMGFTHYTSNLLTAQHNIAGVKKQYHVGILKDTYGQIMVDDKDPGQVSGTSIVSRVDFKGKAWNKTIPVLFNVVVA